MNAFVTLAALAVSLAAAAAGVFAINLAATTGNSLITLFVVACSLVIGLSITSVAVKVRNLIVDRL